MSGAALIEPASVTAVVLNYQGREDTVACLRSLRAMPDTPGRIIIVDNGSKDDSLAKIRIWLSKEDLPFSCLNGEETPAEASQSPWILLSLTENDGYAAGNNAGIRLALSSQECRAVWILNNDTEPQADALNVQCRRLNKGPDVGIVGATVVYFHDKTLVQCGGGSFFNRWLGITSASCGQMRLDEVLALPPEIVEAKLDDIIGASMLIRREVVERIGYLDEAFFLYVEETEYCIRAAKAGYSFAWAQDAVVFHKEGGSTGAHSGTDKRAFVRPAWVDYLGLRNRVYLMRKHYPLFLPCVLAGYAGVILKRLQRKQADRLPLIFKAIWHGLTGRMGKPQLPRDWGLL